MRRAAPWYKADELGAENVAPRCEATTKAGTRCRTSVHGEGTLCALHRRPGPEPAPAPAEDRRPRFPGAEVDIEWLDAFEWTPELLAEYADRARELSARYGSNAPTAELGRWPRGRCQDCRRLAGRRYRLGWRLLCEADAESRLRVRRDLDPSDHERKENR